jgi:hypothetical protein
MIERYDRDKVDKKVEEENRIPLNVPLILLTLPAISARVSYLIRPPKRCQAVRLPGPQTYRQVVSLSSGDKYDDSQVRLAIHHASVSLGNAS